MEVSKMEKQHSETLTEERWHAILNNNAAYDGIFFYAVKTTGIFCRPSCKSKPPNKENIAIYSTAEQALSARFRPCKRCKPTGMRLPDDEWIHLAAEYIDRNYMNNLTLQVVADQCHGSPYHLHRTFKKIKHMTPVEYIQQLRVDKAKEQLTSSDLSISEIGSSVGMRNTPYFVTLFKKKTGCTPAAYRQLHKQEADSNDQTQ
ncbi:AraC family transcriptional regulator [Paenibacillus sp. FSL A5-0031]|nr:AraC family transcriptional regulator [Paenibacillus sp. FSL A5-0031]